MAKTVSKNVENTVNTMNKIRSVASESYKQQVPVLKVNENLYDYGKIILSQPVLKNEFLNVFTNQFMYEVTKQHIFESEFNRLKKPSDPLRWGTFESFVNTIKPIQYDVSALDRILKLYKPDVKTAYFTRNREDIFPMSVTREGLVNAFQSYDNWDSFVTELFTSLKNSNAIVEYNAIKECINVNVNGGAIKTVNIAPITSKTDSERIAKLIRSYAIKMGKPSSEYNSYADLDGAVGDPVETFTPKKSLLLIADAETVSTVGVDVLASAFNLSYADFDMQLITVDDFGYHTYDRENQTQKAKTNSKIKFMICDEALFNIEDDLDIEMSGTNDATLVRQNFYHVWQKINIRPWANAIAFVESENSFTVDKVVGTFNGINHSEEIEITPNEYKPVNVEFGAAYCILNDQSILDVSRAKATIMSMFDIKRTNGTINILRNSTDITNGIKTMFPDSASKITNNTQIFVTIQFTNGVEFIPYQAVTILKVE